jgi:hypothetical protein
VIIPINPEVYLANIDPSNQSMARGQVVRHVTAMNGFAYSISSTNSKTNSCGILFAEVIRYSLARQLICITMIEGSS